MATYADLMAIAGSSTFQSRIRVALFTGAVNVYAEAPATTGHVARAAYAVNVVNGKYDLPGATIAVLTNPAIAAEASILVPSDFGIPDADIQFAVNSLWNLLAGV